jgi:hypothetical protein
MNYKDMVNPNKKESCDHLQDFLRDDTLSIQ